jgi:translation initiation factor 2 beta subunit (eIF-2beta)/eIF-5
VKALSAAQKFIQSLILAELQQYIDIFSVLKEMLKAHDVVLVQATMDLDLRHKLLLGAGLCEGRLRDHFCC